jgi:hypothetical protein
VWPRIAQLFGIDVGGVRPCALADWARDKEPVWQAIVRRHRLVATRLEEVAAWSFADFLFRQDYDVVSSTTKLKQAGFHDVVDTTRMFVDHLARYRDARILP